MVVFSLDSKKHFVNSHNGTTLAIHELETFFSPAIKPENFKFIAIVGQDLEYDELVVFNTIIHGKVFTSLLQDLHRSRLITNREGFSFLNPNSKLSNPNFGIDHCCYFYRINDLFGWAKYGVSVTVSTIWNRCDLESHRVCVNLVREGVKLRKLARQERFLRGEVDSMVEELERERRELREARRKLPIAVEDLGTEREYSRDLVSIVSTLKVMVLELKKKHDDVHEVVVL